MPLVVQVQRENRELRNLQNNLDLGNLFRKCNFEKLVRGRVHKAILWVQEKTNKQKSRNWY